MKNTNIKKITSFIVIAFILLQLGIINTYCDTSVSGAATVTMPILVGYNDHLLTKTEKETIDKEEQISFEAQSITEETEKYEAPPEDIRQEETVNNDGQIIIICTLSQK